MVRVWDLFVRLFHWSMVVALLICFMTEEDTLLLHVVAGYYAAGIIVLRILWGFVGPEHARFSDFLFPPGTVVAYARDLIKLRSARYIGHSPAGGVMILLLLIAVAATAWTGHITYQERQTQTAAVTTSLVITSAQAQEHERGDRRSPTRGLHEALSNLLLLFIIVHIGGVLWASYAHKENLAWSMVTGDKRKNE